MIRHKPNRINFWVGIFIPTLFFSMAALTLTLSFLMHVDKVRGVNQSYNQEQYQ